MAMVTETARVVGVDDRGYAWVETQRKSTCDSCSVQKGCGTGILAKFFSSRRARIRVLNTLGASVGDEVVVGIEDGMLVRTSLAVYIVPLVWMLLGAIMGNMLGERLDSISGEVASTLLGVVGLGIGFLWLRRYARRAARDRAAQPILLRFSGPERVVKVYDLGGGTSSS
jgi:sigma-E factor negative regulatory protein RseC